jgi:Asp-tRNA(Asn)/Glu-tRNA(Gln) amidotransferase B subunit
MPGIDPHRLNKQAAELAIEHQPRLASTDTDFARFQRLRWFNPLARNRPNR